METKNKMAIIVAVIAALGAAAGGSYALDFSNTTTTNTDNSVTESVTIIEGDTIIYEAPEETYFDDTSEETYFGEEYDDELDIICEQDEWPEEYEEACEIWENEP